ncbi:MAG: biopolymer transporter ExbD [Pirellulales bacterium]|nr:biopolymer transporter ExbD [Pirellulales bacterium]
MRIPNNRSRGSVGFNMTPMIDIVFLLIIFFLVSSHLARQETQLELDLPAAASGRRAEDDDRTRRVIVNVLAQPGSTGENNGNGGRIMVGGRVLGENELQKVIEFERRHADGPLEVRIRSDRQVPYGRVEPIMVACAKAGVWNVTFAVLGRGEGR